MSGENTIEKVAPKRPKGARNDSQNRASSTPVSESVAADHIAPQNGLSGEAAHTLQTEETMPEPKSNRQSAPETFNPEVDAFPDFAVSPAEITRRTEELKSFVREQMREGEDYGIIPGGSKPTLFKPGAEKLNAVFGLSPLVEVTSRVEDWDNGFVAYEVKVILLNKRSGGVEAEGIGSCNSRERRYKNQDAAGAANTVLKMAKKRALVDATLSATRASGMFTQDLEDIEFEPQANYAPRQSQPRFEEAPRAQSRPQNAPVQREAVQREVAPASQGGGDVLTDAQHRAIMAIAGRVFGRHSRDEDLVRLVDKPLETLTRHEASGLIDRLKKMLGEDTGAPQNGDRDMQFQRAGNRR